MTVAKKKPAKAAPDLSHERICELALELIDKDGLEEFSTRKLGRLLGCEAMAIYWYYPSKDALLDAVVDRLMSSVGTALAEKQSDDWIATMRALAHAYRQVAHDHPKAFPLLATRRFASESTFAFLDRLFELAYEQGIDEKTTARFYRVISSYCSGFALSELAGPRGPQDPRTAALRKRFPRAAAVSEWLDTKRLDEIFAFGLEVQLEALAAAVHAARRGHAR
jgi:AcrR family transcriptional regulator